MNKPIVHYSKLFSYPEVDCRCIVQPVDHPGEFVSNTKPAITSTVVAVFHNEQDRTKPTFETKNTRYVPSE